MLDLQPVPPGPEAAAGGRVLGRIDQSAMFERFALTEPGVAAAVTEDLFAAESERELDVIQRFDQPTRLIARAAEVADWVLDAELADRLRAAVPPVDVRDRLRLRVFRRL